MRFLSAIIINLPFLVACQPMRCAAQVAPFQKETLISGIYSPVSLAFLPNDRALIITLGGSILITSPLSQRPVSTSPYMSLTDVSNVGEHGLLEILLDPQFSVNHYFYLFYTTTTFLHRVARFTDLGLTGDAASELVIWESTSPFAQCCHAGGAFVFASDGTLLIGVGDDFDPVAAQDLANDHGKIHRFNTDGSIPVDNPFYDNTPGNLNANGVHKSVYGYGLRNPFRGSYDDPTGRFILGVVGGNDVYLSWEDIRLSTAGANHGWPFCGDGGRDTTTGQCNDPQYADPVFSYRHSGAGAAVTGGFVYRGTMFPPEWQGRYFYGDYVRSWIRSLTLGSNNEVLGDSAFMDTTLLGGAPATSVVKLIGAPDGSLYYVSIYDDQITYAGSIERVFWNLDHAPVCGHATVDPSSGPGPTLQVQFTDTASDPEAQPLTYVWFAGDGAPGDTGQTVVHQYNSPGFYGAREVVSDGILAITCPTVSVHVGSPPGAQIMSPADSSFFNAGDVVSFVGAGFDDGPLTEASYGWTVVFHHNEHIHPEVGAIGTSTFGLVVPTTGHGFTGDCYYVVKLTVTDADGLTGTYTVRIYPRKVNVTLTSTPLGLEVLMEGLPYITPFTFDQVVGEQLALSLASADQCVNGQNWSFTAWSDQGPFTHSFTVPASDTSVIAQFTTTGPCAYCGEGLSFDGVDDRVSIPAFVLGGDWTIEFWLRASAGMDQGDAIIGNASDLSLDLKNGQLHLFQGSDLLTSSVSVIPDHWDHYAITRQADTLRLYVNGILDQAASAVVFPGTITITSMGTGINPGSFGGELDEVRIWSNARTQTLIAQNMSIHVDPADPGLFAYWRFDQPPAAQVIDDISTGGHDGVRGADLMAASDDPTFFAVNGPMQYACARSLAMQLKVLLQGPFDGTLGRMKDDLRLLGLIPLVEPYTSMGFVQVGGGGETIMTSVLQTTGPSAIVDWVLIELRNANDPASILITRCALLQADGDVVDVDGTSLPAIVVDRPDYYIAVRHRNHFGAMTAQPLSFANGPVVADFSSPALSCFGTAARLDRQGTLLLWAGNTILDASIKYMGVANDRDPILVDVGGTIPTHVSSGYLSTDVNMDGQVKYAGAHNDPDIILQNIGGNTPANTRTQQLP